MSKLKIFLASINANKLIEELKKDPATLNINDAVLPNHFEDLIEILKGDDTVKTLTMCIRVQFIIIKLYQKLNKDNVIEELAKLKVTDANSILENADKHINEHFFEMVGIAKEVYVGDLFLSTD